MKKSTKYLLAGGVVAAGVAYWWYSNNQHQVAAAQIVSQPPLVPVTPAPLVVAPSPTIPPASTTPAPQSGLTASQQSELSALVAWSAQSQNPALYQQMMQQLTGSQIDNLYSILTTQWEVSGAVPTAAHTAFWNQLRQQFPFLNTGGAGCTNLQCT